MNEQKTAVLYTVMLSLTLPWLFQRNLHGLSGVGTLSVTVVSITAAAVVITCFVRFGEGRYAGSNSHDPPGHDNSNGDSYGTPIYGFDKCNSIEFWLNGFWRAAPTFVEL